ncbi:MAG: M48 family metallopeptidase [Gammaproteobacteria bacterium]|jgi:predicted Zn-dependent protease
MCSARISARIAATVLACLAAVTAHAQLLAGKREIERQSATQWLIMKREMPQITDPRTVRYVECIAGAIIRQLDPEWHELNWEVIVFDNDELNAFAMSGGKIGVFSGIFKVADTPDALAAVIGHEVAHLTEGHVFDRARRASRTTAAAIIGSAATGIHRSVFEMGAQVGMQLPFQRGQESEADVVGLRYMARAGFDPRAGLQLWQNMQAASEDRNLPPVWLSTHPREDERIDDMVPLLIENLKLYNEAQEAGNFPACYRR